VLIVCPVSKKSSVAIHCNRERSYCTEQCVKTHQFGRCVLEPNENAVCQCFDRFNATSNESKFFFKFKSKLVLRKVSDYFVNEKLLEFIFNFSGGYLLKY